MAYKYTDRLDNTGTWAYDKIEGGAEYSLDNLHRNRDENGELNADSWIDVPYCGGSDYSGSSVEASNYKVMKDEYGNHADVAFYYGGHGTYGVIYRENTKDEDLLDIIKGLNDYPLISEDVNSEVEIEWENEAWESWARHDFIDELKKKFTNDLDVEDQADLIAKIEDKMENISDDRIWEIFQAAREEANQYWESENSGMYIDIKKVAAKVTAEDLGITESTEV